MYSNKSTLKSLPGMFLMLFGAFKSGYSLNLVLSTLILDLLEILLSIHCSPPFVTHFI